jgi:hypothetical protein
MRMQECAPVIPPLSVFRMILAETEELTPILPTTTLARQIFDPLEARNIPVCRSPSRLSFGMGWACKPIAGAKPAQTRTLTFLTNTNRALS